MCANIKYKLILIPCQIQRAVDIVLLFLLLLGQTCYIHINRTHTHLITGNGGIAHSRNRLCCRRCCGRGILCSFYKYMFVYLYLCIYLFLIRPLRWEAVVFRVNSAQFSVQLNFHSTSSNAHYDHRGSKWTAASRRWTLCYTVRVPHISR